MVSNPVHTSFLQDNEAVVQGFRNMVTSSKYRNIYLCGPAVKFIVNNLLNSLDLDQYKEHIYVTLPSLTGKDFITSSFLYHINSLADRIRISNRAHHNLVVTGDFLMLLSISNIKNTDNQACGVLVENKDEAKKACNYCQELWKNGFPLHFGAR